MATNPIAEPGFPTPGAAPAEARLGRRGFHGIFILSLGILVLEIALTRVLSVVMWYHFAFVVISLAMLGLALAGIVLYLVPSLVRNAASVIPWSSLLAGLSAVGMLVWLVRVPFAHEGASSLFDADVALFYLIVLLPFLFAGLAISTALSRHSRQISTLYLYDLVGAGVGCVLVVGIINALGAPAAIITSAFFFFLAAALFRKSWSLGAIADQWLLALSVALLAWHLHGKELEPRYMKGLSDAQQVGEPLDAWWNSHSRIRVHAIRGNEGAREISIDGNATTAMLRLSGPATPELVRVETGFLKHWIGAPPYCVIPEKPEVLIIGPGGGREILTGMLFDAQVTGIELNSLIFGLMRSGPHAEWTGNLYTAPGVTTIHDEARSWIRRSDRKFDLIQATLVDTWAATASGAFALAENALYTVEAFEDFFSHLSDGGVVHLTRWQRDPPRETVRTLALMVEVMRRRQLPNPEKHVVVLIDLLGNREGGRPYASLLWSRSPFDEPRLARLQAFIDDRKKLLPDVEIQYSCWPGKPPIDDLGLFLASSDQAGFISKYPYDIRPTTDDQPFFFNTARIEDVASFRKETYQNEQAVVVLVTVLGTVLVIVLLAFAVPFALRYRKIRAENGPGTLLRLLYFSGLGIGFMLVEIPLLQRFGLYLGHPTYALTTILASLLAGTGIGSALAGWCFGSRPVIGARTGLLLLIAAIGTIVTVIPDLLQSTLAESLTTRLLVTVGLLLPLGILMGFPFPLGVRALESRRPSLVPWAWGINGATSVLASVLGVALGMYAGFTTAAIVGAAAYFLSLLTAGRLAKPMPGP